MKYLCDGKKPLLYFFQTKPKSAVPTDTRNAIQQHNSQTNRQKKTSANHLSSLTAAFPADCAACKHQSAQTM